MFDVLGGIGGRRPRSQSRLLQFQAFHKVAESRSATADEISID